MSGSTRATSEADRAVEATVRKRVLVVDDEPDLRLMLTRRLRAAGYDVVTASDGLEATSTALETRPDVIVLDLGLPGLDGHAVAKELWAHGRPRFPIVVLSARSAIEDRTRAGELGAAAYLVKPYDPEELLAAVRSALAAGAAT